MGFIRANMLPILHEHKKRPFSGHLLMLGQGDIYFSYEHLKRFARLAKVELRNDVEITPSYIPSFAEKGYISAESVFKSIGFSQVSILDYSRFEGAKYAHDLNNPEIPQELVGQFDAVFDHGTTEHVFHFPNALNNIFKMLKVGGRVAHSAPGNNYFDHGFYQIQPTLFHDFYSENNWNIDTITVFQMTPNQETEVPFFAEYEPGMFENVSYGKLDAKMYGVVTIATKTSQSTGDRAPQQFIYKRSENWRSQGPQNQGAQESPTTVISGFESSAFFDSIKKYVTKKMIF